MPPSWLQISIVRILPGPVLLVPSVFRFKNILFDYYTIKKKLYEGAENLTTLKCPQALESLPPSPNRRSSATTPASASSPTLRPLPPTLQVTPPPDPSIPTTFLDISNSPAAMRLCLRICMVPLTEPTSSLLAASSARAFASASFCALRRQTISLASSCLLTSSRLASSASFANLSSSSFSSLSCSLKSASSSC